ncbi:MAG: S8 family peptidase [Lewinellaceae bacterium]|nr:S8 family peptidase [Lewinellaceae bacterium]
MWKKLLWVALFLPPLLGSAQKSATIIQGQVLVKLRPAATPQNFMVEFATHSRSGGGVWVEKSLSKRGNIHLLRFDTVSVDPDMLIVELRKDNNVEYAQWDWEVETRSQPNDPNVADQWGIFTIQADKAWDLTTGGVTGRGDTIVVAILDSGFDVLHEDLRPNIWTNRGEIPGDGIDNDKNGYIDDYQGWNFVANAPDHIPETHGQSVAGIIGARGNNGRGVTGINWQIKLMLFETRMVSDIIAAYEYIIDQRDRYNKTSGREGALVVATNASFGVNRIFCSDQPMWGQMYDRMGEVGILTAAGAANNPWDIDAVGDMPTTCSSPYLMTVLNTDNYDQKYLGSAFGRQSIDMGAPGQNSYTTQPFGRYGTFNGNSAAAPHLAGAIALLYGLPRYSLADAALTKPGETALAVRKALMEGVDPVEGLTDFTATGGRLNVFRAAQLLQNQFPADAPTEGGERLNIFPNPARDEVFIEVEGQESSDCEITIFNILGQPIQYLYCPPGIRRQRLVTADWAPGTYFAMLNRGGKVAATKFMIQQRNQP